MAWYGPLRHSVATSSMDTSTCWPTPERRACNHADAAPTAAKAPVSHSTMAPPALTGGRSGRPRRAVAPHAACTVNSVAGRSAHGPSLPHGLTVTTATRAFASIHRAGGSASQCPVPGA